MEITLNIFVVNFVCDIVELHNTVLVQMEKQKILCGYLIKQLM